MVYIGYSDTAPLRTRLLRAAYALEMTDPVDLITSSPLGTRMTVRRRIDDGFSDALGYLREITETGCVVETRRGFVAVAFAEVTAAKLVPPPPPRRAPRYPVE